MAKDKGAPLKFEEALKRLEEIVTSMEGGKLPLDQAIERYEEGVKLTRFCVRTLDAAEKRIEILAKGQDGMEAPRPFPSEGGVPAEGGDPPRGPRRRSRGEEPFLL